ncbi:MAG TPA: ferrochelatase [Segeticoccus sp.]|nr:ferrochelatase [Segeticoccus sp.]
MSTADESPLAPYDAVLLLSFGGPEAPEEVMPFLRTVTAGRGIPDERLESVAEHYHHFGGRSPINDQNRALLAALRAELDRREVGTRVLWGNRNSAPFVTDALRQAHEQGVRRVVTIVTSAYSSYSSCRQYREDLAAALQTLQDEGRDLVIDKIRPYPNHPAFTRTNTRLVTDAARAALRDTEADRLRLAYVTHSIPVGMDDTSGPGDSEGNAYQRQHAQLAAAITDEVAATLGVELRDQLVYCSRSGPPSQPWLEPDVGDHLRELAAEGAQTVVLAPIGFVSDHMEVRYDLDTEAQEVADELGLRLVRVPTVGTDTEFVSGLVDLVEERAAQARGEDVTGPAWPDPHPLPAVCPAGCCPNLRTPRPALCGMD